jgi:hypothetical protein
VVERVDVFITAETKSRNMSEGSTTATRSKVARLLEKYDRDELGDELVDRWTRSEDRESLRTLATYFNQQLLAVALNETSVDPLEGELENTYRLLTDDDISEGRRTQARRRLEQSGIDVDELQSDFVSRQAIHTYLTSYRDVEREETDDGDPVASVGDTIERIRGRLRAISESQLARLRDTDRLSLGSFQISIDVRVLCQDCGSQYDIATFLDRGGCDCPDE